MRVAELEGRLFDRGLRPEWEVREPLPVTGYEYLLEAAAGLFG
jgi:hypothetical protein